MIIRNEQTKGALRRLGILIMILVSIQALSFKTKNVADSEYPSVYQYGKASYYAGQFIGRKTANGEIFTSNEYTCAHKTLPFGTKLKVTNLDNGEAIIVRVNDRGPYVKNRIVDLSLKGAHELGLMQSGIANVSIEIVNSQFSSLGNTKNMDRIFVDHQFAYIKSNDDGTFEKLYDYLKESMQLVTHSKSEKEKSENLTPVAPLEIESKSLALPIKDSLGTSNDKQALVIEE